MLLHTQLRVKQDTEIADDGLRLDDVRPNGYGSVDVAELGETRLAKAEELEIEMKS